MKFGGEIGDYFGVPIYCSEKVPSGEMFMGQDGNSIALWMHDEWAVWCMKQRFESDAHIEDLLARLTGRKKGLVWPSS